MSLNRTRIRTVHSSELTYNECAILHAILSESYKQGTDEPKITMSMFRDKHSVYGLALPPALKNLMDNKIISRKVVPYRGKVNTYAYKTIRKLKYET